MKQVGLITQKWRYFPENLEYPEKVFLQFNLKCKFDI